MSGRRATAAAAALVALAAFAPFARGALAGSAFYFRDLALHFFPLRRFVAEGLRLGQVRWWNPYVHEGEPTALPPLGYPLDLLHALWPDERGLSLLLALHVPLAALACFALARGLGLGRAAAAASGLCYALGGFALSCLNLYIYLQALAWAPLAILGMLRASASGDRRTIGLASAAVGVCLSTTGVEIAAQAMILAFVLALARTPEPKAASRTVLVAVLGAALAAVPLAVMAGQVPGSARGAGFPTDVVLGHSVHPLTFVQVLVAGLYGDPSRIVERWWGQNFFPRGFPYFLSLYLGAAAVALALVGAAHGGRRGRVLGAAAVLGALVCLGPRAGLEPLVEHVALLRRFRFPAKAFFTVHASAALLVGLAVERLAAGSRASWRLFAWVAGLAALPLLLAPALAVLVPGAVRWFAAGFFPPGMSWAVRMDRFAFVARDAAIGGAVALCCAAVAVAFLAGRIRASPAAAVLAAMVGADLLRSGAGLNPMAAVETLRPSPAVHGLAAEWRAEGRRIFTCDLDQSPSYYRARALRDERHEVWSTWTLLETLSPSFNVPLGVPSAYSPDLTMLVPVERVLPLEPGCGDVGAIADRLRLASVAHVVTVDRLSAPGLSLEHLLEIPRLAPLAVHVYRLEGGLPMAEIPDGRVLAASESPGRLELAVDAERATTLIVRQARARGWSAEVNGRAAPLETREGWHMAVAVAPGRTRVVLTYRPPGLVAGAAVTAAALAAIVILLVPAVGPGRRRRAH